MSFFFESILCVLLKFRENIADTIKKNCYCQVIGYKNPYMDSEVKSCIMKNMGK